MHVAFRVRVPRHFIKNSGFIHSFLGGTLNASKVFRDVYGGAILSGEGGQTRPRPAFHHAFDFIIRV